MIARQLEEYGRAIGHQILVTNTSVNGRTTRQALEDMPYHVQNFGTDILVVQFGLNDCNYWETDKGLPRVSLDAFEANLKEIVNRGRRFGAHRILLNNSHPTTRNERTLPHTEITYEASNRQYNAAARRVAKALPEDVIFQDIESEFNRFIANGEQLSMLLLDDGLHLSEAGHLKYFGIMSAVVTRAVDDFLMIANAAQKVAA